MNTATQSFLGRYRLVKVLGQGAMGVVYEAVDTRLNRTVAIKTVLRSHMADETTANEYAARFEREAQAAARLAHPHVVTVYDFGEHEDISYIVMEFVRGRELNQAFESGEKFPLADAIRIMRELLAALDYAHQQGIVHRDIKPANVMLDAAGHVKLTDFGVARVANANADRTMPGTLVGTPSYMSPEQILGLAVGSRTDIFAAGVILYQFLAGKRPFSGGGPFGVQRKIVQDDPDPPSAVNPEIPAAFDLVIAKALAKDPDKRYESAAAFSADLERVSSSLPREVPLIDLDLAPDPSPGTQSPRGTVASGRTRTPSPDASLETSPGMDIPLTLKTGVPFGGQAAPPPPPVAQPPADPESTVIVFRPSAPEAPASPGTVSGRTTKPSPGPVPAPAPAPAPAVRTTVPPAPPPAPRPPPPAPAPAPQPAAARRPEPRAEPRRAVATDTPRKSSAMPIVAGAGVGLLVVAGWLAIARPWAGKAEAPPPPNPAAPAPAPTAQTAPTPVAVPAQEPAPTAAPPATAAPAPVQAAPSPAPAPRAEAPGTKPRPAPDPVAAKPVKANEPAPRPAGAETRCSDLLQRMQLGEPLTADQTAYFQSRCTR